MCVLAVFGFVGITCIALDVVSLRTAYLELDFQAHVLV